MGKKIIIKGANFSENAINVNHVVDFSLLPVKPFNIASDSNQVNFLAPTSGNPPKPSFYVIDLSSLEGQFSKIKLKSSDSIGSRIVLTSTNLPDSTEGQLNINSYLSSTVEDSYFKVPESEEQLIDIPSGTNYIYIRKYSTTFETTPLSAILIE